MKLLNSIWLIAVTAVTLLIPTASAQDSAESALSQVKKLSQMTGRPIFAVAGQST